MSIRSLLPGSMKLLTRDARLLFLSRFIRLFAYGSLSVVLVFYLIGLGLRESQTGILLTLTLIGDTVISLYLTTRADRMGRRRMLIVGSILMAAAGLAFACTSNFFFLLIAGTIGVISPSGNEVGPFLSIEQAALAHVVPDQSRTDVFAWYTLAGSVATASGALFAGAITGVLQRTTLPPVAAYRAVVVLYAVLGAFLAVSFLRLSSATEVHSPGDGVSLAGDAETLFRHCAIPPRDRQAFQPVRLGLVRRWFCRAELRGVLVLPAFRSSPGDSWSHFLLGKYLCRHFSASGSPSGCALGPGQHHGPHPSSVQHSAHSCSTHAQSLARGSGASPAIQYQPDGRSHAAILRHGSRAKRRAIRGCRNHRRGPHHRSRYQPFVRRIYVRAELPGSTCRSSSPAP